MERMKLNAKLLIALIIGLFTLSSVFSSFTKNVTIKNAGVIKTILPLHVEGRYIKDALNNTVILRGVNAGGFLDRPYGWWRPKGGGLYSGLDAWRPDAVKHNLDAMKMWGFNALRMHLNVEWWITNPNQYGNYQMPQPFRDCVKDVIRWAGERGIYVIIDFYSVQAGTGQDNLPFPPYCLNGSEEFIPNIETFVEFWVNVTSELKEFPNVLFELWNEPFWDGYNEETAAQDWFNAVNQTISAIRTISDHIIIVQWDRSSWANLDHKPVNPPQDGSTLWWTQKYPIINAPNIVYSTHLYRPFGRNDGSLAYLYDDMKLGMTWIVGNFTYYTKPIIIGEMGANMWYNGIALDQELTAYNNLLKILNEWNISYCVFEWRDTATGIRYGQLQNTNYIPPPNRAGVITIAQTNQNPFVFSAGIENYLYSNDVPFTEQWFSENKTLKVTLKGTGNRYLRIFWKYPITSSVKIEFLNGTRVDAQNYYEATTGIISLLVISNSNEEITLYDESRNTS